MKKTILFGKECKVKMRERIRTMMNKKAFHIVVIIVIIAAILFFLGITILKYNVEGETNMPITLTKISVISSSEGIDKEAGEDRWAFDINQNNDLYIYLEKNKNYEKEELLEAVSIENIHLEKMPQKGQIMFYKPDAEATNGFFVNKEEDKIENLNFQAGEKENIASCEISNQGGKIAFRYAINNVAECRLNDEEIRHEELLKKSGVTFEELQSTLQFDLIIKFQSGKEFKTTITLELPINEVVEKGVASQEFTNMGDFIFKRIKN